MDAKTLVSELVRARLAELENMRTKLEKIITHLEVILRIQVQCETTIEENEARGYALAEALEGDRMDQGSMLSFDVLIEMAINTLKR
ncbi:hypothetical protein PC129_g3235 [Phytophthora cactorum]|uniref:Uncharacterized protein n=1 Tax=Phytophthora cactorum TaxID=29920 RepID=A0A329SNK4_9STRA|nr:hypothetical protein GQ600_5190 [Phytophthora cactorum]KAG2764421.1 hypothetical protein Pcac1_g23882 [Phytophthora cactorum]KAG2847076.1 hypothetical protein PC111_g944 [Phytophthora cactorum]KAG2847886.1 hypothetical protein PC112_g930 [Phytophthora cactorum]KAG2867097.1 hypothetical protein PC113_g2242 [Phytophthora cactorum]